MTAFAKAGPLYRPISTLGWVITLAAVAFMLQVGWAIERQAPSGTDMLYGIYPFWGVTFLLWDWTARRLSAN